MAIYVMVNNRVVSHCQVLGYPPSARVLLCCMPCCMPPSVASRASEVHLCYLSQSRSTSERVALRTSGCNRIKRTNSSDCCLSNRKRWTKWMPRLCLCTDFAFLVCSKEYRSSRVDIGCRVLWHKKLVHWFEFRAKEYRPFCCSR